MDKGWMSKSRLSKEYEEGVETFLNFAISNGKNPNAMSCPCVKCGNLRDHDAQTIRAHLTYNGIDQLYRVWILHGEIYTSEATDKAKWSTPDTDFNSYDETVDMVNAAYVDNPNLFHEVLEEAEIPLYPKCAQFTKLSAIVKLYNLKTKFGWSDTSFTELLLLIKEMLPKDNVLPHSLYDARRSLSVLGLGYEKIHACLNDCVLYRHEHENLMSCPTCGDSRWKSTLFKKHVAPYDNAPTKQLQPPQDEPIKEGDWKDFVILRKADEARKSDELKARRAMNLYPHRLSRKGYVGLREEMEDQLSGYPRVDRAILWKKARQNKERDIVMMVMKLLETLLLFWRAKLFKHSYVELQD